MFQLQGEQQLQAFVLLPLLSVNALVLQAKKETFLVFQKPKGWLLDGGICCTSQAGDANPVLYWECSTLCPAPPALLPRGGWHRVRTFCFYFFTICFFQMKMLKEWKYLGFDSHGMGIFLHFKIYLFSCSLKGSPYTFHTSAKNTQGLGAFSGACWCFQVVARMWVGFGCFVVGQIKISLGYMAAQGAQAGQRIPWTSQK